MDHTGIIHSSLIVSAFENAMDEGSLDYYRNKNDLEWGPIKGYPGEITEDDIGKTFFNGEEVDESHVGEKCFFVTDGHHRSTVAAERGICLQWELDYSAIVDEETLLSFA